MGREYDSCVTKEKWLITPHAFKLEAKLSPAVALFIKMWVHNDDWGQEVYLSRKDRLELLRIKLRGVKTFIKNYESQKK